MASGLAAGWASRRLLYSGAGARRGGTWAERKEELRAVPIDVDTLAIVSYPDPALRRKTTPITEIDDDLERVAKRMIELMHQGEGVGLAGPQVAFSKRMFIMCPTAEVGAERVVLNPIITNRSREKKTDIEGCLSLPDIRGKVERPVSITLTYYDLDGEEVQADLSGFEARVAQHEYDHLEGVLIIDRFRPAERSRTDKRLRELIYQRERALEKQRA